MRIKSLYILLFSLMILPAFSAFARPRPKHPPAKTATRERAKSSRAQSSPKAKNTSKSAKTEKPAKPLTRAQKRAQAREEANEKRHPKTHSKHSRATPERDPEPEPERAPAPASDPHIRHDRKHHLTPTPATPSASQPPAPAPAEPHKASASDFLTSPPITPAPAPVASVVEVIPATVIDPSPAKPVPVISVARKASVPRPQLPTVAELVETPVLMNALFDRRGRLIVPPAMKGTHEILVHQNVMADHDGLDRIQDDEDLERMRDGKLLVAIPQSNGLVTDDRLPSNRRFTRPWTAQFLATLARAHYARFHTALQVNSAVRTVEFQQRLIRTNGNAAPAEGETASPHLTGQAVDLAKHGLSMTEIAWMRAYLGPLVEQGKVDVEEEFQQACFHISVYRKYVPAAAPKKLLVARRGGGALANGAMR